jgi:hypothetical protein
MSSHIHVSAALILVPSFKGLDVLQSRSGRYGEEKREQNPVQPVA